MDSYRDSGVIKTYALIAGAVLVLVGLLGFLNTALAGPQPEALLRVNAIHNIVHIVTGAIGLYIALALTGRAQVQAMLGFAILYTVIFVAVLFDPTLLGLFRDAPANMPLHVIHAALAAAGFLTYYLGRTELATRAARTAA